MRKFLKAMLWTLGVLFVVAIALTFFAYRALRQEPEFYQMLLEQEPLEQEAASEELAREVAQLQEEVDRKGNWEAVFKEEQINAWLVSQLPELYPRALPPDISDPRVKLNPGEAWLAFRYHDENLSTVLSIAISAELTGEPNELSIRLLKARSGILPIPKSKVLQRVRRALFRAGAPVRWEEIDGETVAFAEIPAQSAEQPNRKLRVEKIELREGELFAAGVSEAIEEVQEETAK